MGIIITDSSISQYERKPSGYILLDDKEVAATLQCCHCGGHFVSIKGSGKKRGFCMCCMRVTCGAAGCDHCVPFDRRLELYEKGLISNLATGR